MSNYDWNYCIDCERVHSKDLHKERKLAIFWMYFGGVFTLLLLFGLLIAGVIILDPSLIK